MGNTNFLLALFGVSVSVALYIAIQRLNIVHIDLNLDLPINTSKNDKNVYKNVLQNTTHGVHHNITQSKATKSALAIASTLKPLNENKYCNLVIDPLDEDIGVVGPGVAPYSFSAQLNAWLLTSVVTRLSFS